MSKTIQKNNIEIIIKSLQLNITKISKKKDEFKTNLEKIELEKKENNLKKQNEIFPQYLSLADKINELNVELEEIENQICKYKKKQKLILLTLNNKKFYHYLKELNKIKENEKYFFLIIEFLGYNNKKNFDDYFICFHNNFSEFLSMFEHSNKILLKNNEKYLKIKNLLTPILTKNKNFIQNPIDQIINYIQFSINLFELKDYKKNILNEINFQEKIKNEKFILLKQIEFNVEKNLFKEVLFQNNLNIINNFVIEYNIYKKKYNLNNIEN